MVVFKNNIKSFFSSPIKVLIIFLLPFVFVGLFLTGEEENIPIKVAVIDKDNTEFSIGLTDEIERSCKLIECEENEVMDQLINSQIEYVIIIESGYTEKLLDGEEVCLTQKYFINKEKLYPLMASIEDYVNNARILYSVSESEEEFYEKVNQINDYNIEYSEEIVEVNTLHGTVYALGFMIQFILYSGIIIAAFLIIDKETNVTTRILVSPKSLTTYMVEHFVSYVVLEIIIVTLLNVTLKILFNYNFEDKFILITLMMILFSISILALCLMLVSICKKSKIAYWVMVCLTTPMLMLGGCYFEISIMPEVVQNASKFLPTRWIMDIVREVLLCDNTENVLITVFVLIAFTLAYLSISRSGLKKLLSDK